MREYITIKINREGQKALIGLEKIPCIKLLSAHDYYHCISIEEEYAGVGFINGSLETQLYVLLWWW